MNKYLASILIGIVALFCLNEIKGEIFHESPTEISIGEWNSCTHMNACLCSPQAEYEATGTNAQLLLAAINLRAFEAPMIISASPRGVSFPRNLKFTSTIQVLSSLSTPLYTRDAKDLYFQHCFVKSSYRYFIYTLHRLLI